MQFALYYLNRCCKCIDNIISVKLQGFIYTDFEYVRIYLLYVTSSFNLLSVYKIDYPSDVMRFFLSRLSVLCDSTKLENLLQFRIANMDDGDLFK